MKLRFGQKSGCVKMFLDMVGRAGRSQNGGTDDTKEGDVHERVGSASHDWGIIEERANQRERAGV